MFICHGCTSFAFRFCNYLGTCIKNPLDHSLLFILLYLKLCLNIDRLMISLNCTSFLHTQVAQEQQRTWKKDKIHEWNVEERRVTLSLIIDCIVNVILGFKVICCSQDFLQKSPLIFMITATAIYYLRLTYKLTMLFDAIKFWSANFCHATAHKTSHPTEFLWCKVQTQAEIRVRSVDRKVGSGSVSCEHQQTGQYIYLFRRYSLLELNTVWRLS